MEGAVFPYTIRMAYQDEWEDAMALPCECLIPSLNSCKALPLVPFLSLAYGIPYLQTITIYGKRNGKMGKLFNIDSPVMRFLGKVADLMILNLVTLLCCIPVVTIGASLTPKKKYERHCHYKEVNHSHWQ